MRTPEEIRRDLPPNLDPLEREQLVALALRLEVGTPAPAPTFRGSIRRRLLDAPNHGATGASSITRAFAAANIAVGALLLGVAVLGLIGVGPLTPAS